MSSHPNAVRIRDLFEAFKTQDVDAIRDALADDVVWHFPGRTGKLAGSHRGREQVFAFLLSVASLTEGTFHLDLEHVVADDDYAVAMFRGHGTRPDGRILNNPTCLKIRMVAGRAVEIHEFVWNLFDVDSFWE